MVLQVLFWQTLFEMCCLPDIILIKEDDPEIKEWNKIK